MANFIGTPLHQLLLSFFAGMLSVCTLSVTADRASTKLAGALGGFPATVAASLFFLGTANGIQTAVESTTIIPASMGIYCLALGTFLFFIQHHFLIALAGNFLVWLLATAGLTYFQPYTLKTSLLLCISGGFLGWLLMQMSSSHDVSNGRKRNGAAQFTIWQALLRSVTGGVLVSSALVVGSLAGPFWGGIMSTLPAVTFSTIIVTYQLKGTDFSAGIAKALLVSGYIGVTTYALIARWSYPSLGMELGTAAAAVTVILIGALIMAVAQTNMSLLVRKA